MEASGERYQPGWRIQPCVAVASLAEEAAQTGSAHHERCETNDSAAPSASALSTSQPVDAARLSVNAWTDWSKAAGSCGNPADAAPLYKPQILPDDSPSHWRKLTTWLLDILLITKHAAEEFAATVKHSPSIILLPLLLVCLIAGLGIWAVLASAQNYSDAQRSGALRTARHTALSLQTELQLLLTPCIAMASMVLADPQYPAVHHNFMEKIGPFLLNVLAPVLPQFANLDTTLELGPLGYIQSIYPVRPWTTVTGVSSGSTSVLGMDVLDMSSGSEIVLDYGQQEANAVLSEFMYAIKTGHLAIDSIMYTGEIYEFVSYYPVFLRGFDANETFGLNKRPNPTYCTDCKFYNDETREIWWGNVETVINIKLGEEPRLQTLVQDGYDYQLFLPPPGSYDLNGPDHYTVLAANSTASFKTDPVEAKVLLGDGQACLLRLAPASSQGYTPTWTKGLLAAVVVAAALCGALLVALMTALTQFKMMLHKMLPRRVIQALQCGRKYVEPFSQVTIVFSDIVSYTAMSTEMTPEGLRQLLNAVFSEYDRLCAKNGMYKVETIGDAFQCVAGCPERCSPEEAARRAANMALEMMDFTNAFVNSDGRKIRIRVGMATGDVTAAVVDSSMLHMTLIGDTVHVATRMETESLPNRVHITPATAQLLSEFTEFALEPRPCNVLKGKGSLSAADLAGTFWLSAARPGQAPPRLSLKASASAPAVPMPITCHPMFPSPGSCHSKAAEDCGSPSHAGGSPFAAPAHSPFATHDLDVHLASRTRSFQGGSTSQAGSSSQAGDSSYRTADLRGEKRTRSGFLSLGHITFQPSWHASRSLSQEAMHGSCSLASLRLQAADAGLVLKHRFKDFATTAKHRPAVVLLPLLLACVAIGLGVWALRTSARSYADNQRSDAEAVVSGAALNLQTTFELTLTGACVAMASLVLTSPHFPLVQETFTNKVGPSIFRQPQLDPVNQIHLMPFGRLQVGAQYLESKRPLTLRLDPTFTSGANQTVTLVYLVLYRLQGSYLRPQTASSVLFPLDSLNPDDPLNSPVMQRGIETAMARNTSFTVMQRSGGDFAAVAFFAVFLNGFDANETFGLDRGPTASGCPNCPFYDQSARRIWWGNVAAAVSLDGIGNETTLRTLVQDGYDYQLFTPPPGSYEFNAGTAGCTFLAASSTPAFKNDPVEATILMPDGQSFLLRIAPASSTGYSLQGLPGLLAAIVVAAVLCGALLVALLTALTQIQTMVHKMLPQRVIQTLRRGRTYAEPFSQVTIVFSDIVSYTAMSTEMTPEGLRQLLNAVFSEYDRLCAKNGMYKVETIGAQFLCVAGCPDRCSPEEAARRAANMALEMTDFTNAFVNSDGRKIRIRVGMATGDVTAAVVGTSMLHMTLIGDTVNVAARMESNSLPNRMHVAPSTAQLLSACKEFVLEPRGAMDIKGKGMMETFWLGTPERSVTPTPTKRSFFVKSSRAK